MISHCTIRQLVGLFALIGLLLGSVFGGVLLAPVQAANDIIHVKPTPSGASDGSSWADATTLHDALTNRVQANDGDEIWVAAGTYTPDEASPGDRTLSFDLVDGVEIYGGFPATGNPGFGDRDPNPATNGTVLSGDLNGDDTANFGNRGDNSYNVVEAPAGVSGTALLDGFTITGGNADSTIFPNNNGGGILNRGTSTARFANLLISDNQADNEGGGVFNSNSGATFINVTISGNQAPMGGGVRNFSNSFGPTFMNVTISGNTATNEGGGVADASYTAPTSFINVTIAGNQATNGGGIEYNGTGNPTVQNSIIAGNTATNGPQANVAGTGTPAYDYSLVEGEDLTGVGTGNLDGTTATAGFVAPENPTNAPTTAGDYRLQSTSDAIDAGDNTLNTIPTDLDGNPRIRSGTIDLGAYEYNPPIYVDAGATGADDGTSWTDAYASLQDALADSDIPPAGGSIEIWVTTGVYTPGAARADTFELVNGVQIYGGFSPGNTQLSDRDPDPATNGTVLSGDIGTPGDASDNVYHVVTGSGTDTTAVLDGFTITGGNADGSNPQNRGGGIYTSSSSQAQFANLTISGNTATFGGGVFNSSSSPSYTNVTISGNTATFGSGVGGGGVFNDGGSPSYTNVTISGNTATNDGGGVVNRGSPSYTNVTISGNTANDDGGGVFNDTSSSPSFTNVTISGNTATSEGGGIYNNASGPGFTNVTISGNTATFGGGVFNNNNSSASYTNVTISGNTATSDDGGGVYNNFGSSLIVENSVIWGNAGSQVENQSSTTVYTTTLVQGLDLTSTGTGNLDGTTADPAFVAPEDPANAPTTAGDYRLQNTSDAIDAGDNSLNSEATDLDGNPRILDGDGDSTATIDLGGYEVIPDTTAPNPPVVTGGPTIETDDPTPTFSGTAEPGSTVTVVIDLGGGESVTYETTADGNGDWSIDLGSDTPTDGTLPSGGLGTGSYPVSITATDAADNASTPTALTLTITDTTAPNPPVVTGGPTIETDDPTPTFSGTAEPGSTVTVVIDLGGGESVTYETTADGNGDWSIDLGSDTPTDGTLPSGGLGTGSYPVSITATDAADNASTPTALTLTITAGPADFTTLYLPFVAR